METTKVVFTGHATGEIQLFSDDLKAGKMDIAVINNNLTVYHTKVGPQFESQGFTKILLDRSVGYAREKN